MNQPVANCILVFDSIHHVLTAERAFQQAGIWCDLVPTPRAIHSDCGMVVEFRPADRQAVVPLVQSLPRQPRAVYQPSQGQYHQLPW